MAKQDRSRTATDAAIAFARDDLASFATLMHRRFELARHHRSIIEQLERVERGEIDRLMWRYRRGTAKSLIAHGAPHLPDPSRRSTAAPSPAGVPAARLPCR